MLDSDNDEYLPEKWQLHSLVNIHHLGEVDENALNEDEESEIEDDDDKDEESEIEMPISGPVMTAKDGTKWGEIPTSEHQVARHNIVRQRCGPNRNTNMLSNLDTFKLFFTPMKWLISLYIIQIKKQA